MAGGDALSELEQAVLEFERTWWTKGRPATKAEAIRNELGLTKAHYYALLAGLVDSGAALAYDPLLVRRLRRRRSDRLRARLVGEAPRRRERR